MESFNELLEDELSQAVEVKDAKSLHRAVVLLGNYVSQREHEESRRESQSQFERMQTEMGFLRQEFREESRVWHADFEKTLAGMKEHFEAVDKRFDDVNRRFEEARIASDKRFDDVNRRFEDARIATEKRFEDANKRFDDSSKRFNTVQWLIGTGFVVLAALMSLYQVL